jgi:solute carrier family 25 carnitine/acylcarnitine transporter 20/29
MQNDFLYGLLGGLTGTIISHPFDTVKTRIQSNTSKTILNAVSRGKLYSGLTPPLVGIMLEKSIVFGFYEKTKSYGWNNFVSGLVGGFISTIVVTPVDRLKINYQNNELKITSLNQLKQIIKPSNLYKGFTPTIFRETPGFGIYFSTYNYLSQNYNSSKNYYKTFLFGSLSGLSAWIFIYPSDLIKTKYQAENNNKSLPYTITNIWNQNNSTNKLTKGMNNFYRGFSLAIMRAMPLHGGVFFGYEVSKKYLQ